MPSATPLTPKSNSKSAEIGAAGTDAGRTARIAFPGLDVGSLKCRVSPVVQLVVNAKTSLLFVWTKPENWVGKKVNCDAAFSLSETACE